MMNSAMLKQKGLYMSKQTINNTFSLTVPDSFEPVSGKELQELSSHGGDPYRWGVRDREKHVLLIAMWKQYFPLLAWLADLKAMAKKNEQMTRKVYEKHNYKLLGFESMRIGDIKAEGYRFSYSVENIRQTVTNYLVKDGKTVYALMCFGREENLAADQAEFRGIMESLRRV